MSYDRQIDQVCPHIVIQEYLPVELDGQTIRPIRPVASSNSVAVRLNGEIDVPPSGVYSDARILSQQRGPITVKSGVNDIVRILVGNSAPQTAQLHTCSNRPVQEIASILNTSLTGVIFFADNSGRLGIRSNDTGTSATFMALPGSTFLTSVGIPLNRQYRGATVVPAWDLVRDMTTLSDRPRRNVIFREVLKGFADFVEINYSTVRQECRRCGATGMENDWRYTLNGEVVQVTDEALLIQEIQKIMLTIQGSNTFQQWYGTHLLDSIGKKLSPNGAVLNVLYSDIQTAFQRWQSVKRQQEQKVGQKVSDREFPQSLVAIDMRQSTQDPSVVFIDVTIQNRSQDPIVIQRGIRFPLPLDFVEPNSTLGSMRQSLSDYVLTG
jgi:phage baseplate assembly protein W